MRFLISNVFFSVRPRSRPNEWYVFHNEHQAYLEDYARKYNIASSTRFNTRVEKVDEIVDGNGRSQGWSVWSQTIEVEEEGEEAQVTRTWRCDVSLVAHVKSQPADGMVQRFDAVVCASGHHK
jgi:cation diffusion facilitator CzcD-associated flavoprotein CzcO